MVTDLRHLADGRENELSRIPLGRNRALRTLGVALFGLAVRAALPKSAAASINPPYPCFGLSACTCCNQHESCDPGAYAISGVGCPGGGHCWFTCQGTTLYQCCDWFSPNGNYNQPEKPGTEKYCICSGWAGTCGCPGCG